MSKTKEQLAFETWMETEVPKFNTDRCKGEASSEYYGIITELMWRAWKARSEIKERAVDVPTGYKLVPLLPNLAMCEASGFDVSESREAYKKMVLAAPECTEQRPEYLYTFERVKEIVNKTKEDTLNACITLQSTEMLISSDYLKAQ